MKDKVWIVGPCSMESIEFYLDTAKKLYKTMKGKNWYYKASFDKANRTSLYGGRGPGLEDALEAFKLVKQEFPDIKLVTDVHETHQVEKLADYIDCIQIPAFLCRQTDLIVESARHFNFINIKKGQWLGPENMIKSLDKDGDMDHDMDDHDMEKDGEEDKEDKKDKEEAYANEPDEEYKDIDYITQKTAGGMNRRKGTHPKVAGGDNPMQKVGEADLRNSIKEQLLKALEEHKGA